MSRTAAMYYLFPPREEDNVALRPHPIAYRDPPPPPTEGLNYAL